jgi:hypothetical protein
VTVDVMLLRGCGLTGLYSQYGACYNVQQIALCCRGCFISVLCHTHCAGLK